MSRSILPPRAARGERIVALGLALACLALLSLAAWLKPAGSGIGTHRQLGLPPCGWMIAANFPCPTCGMTTAFAAAANAQPLKSFASQPMGALLALLTAVIFWGSVHVAAFGSQLGHLAGRMLTTRLLWVTLALGLLAWAYKIAQVRGWSVNL
jgi:TRAP-type C4-dicarboxylate transport system permease small subunit